MASSIYDNGGGLDCYVITPPTSDDSGDILEGQQHEDKTESGIPIPKQNYPTHSIPGASGVLQPETLFTGCLPLLSPIWSDVKDLRYHQLATLSNDPRGTYSNSGVTVDSTDNVQDLDTSLDGEARSVRARNAAKQRHNKYAKRLRLGDGVSQQERTREKNRIAAAKCRSKKKKALTVLERDYDIMSTANNILRGEERNLREQLTHWRTLALQHSTDQSGCYCDLVQQYNTHQAMKAAKIAGDGAIESYVDLDGCCNVAS